MMTPNQLTMMRRRPGLLQWAICVLLSTPTLLSAQDRAPTSSTSRLHRTTVSMDFEGFTTPKYDVLVAATEIGRLEEVNVSVGDRVASGDVIAKLEDGMQIEAVATAQWRAQMHGEIDAAQAETRLMKLRLDQLQTLADRQVARPDELKRALADWEIAMARELSAKEQDKLRGLELSRYQLQLQRRKIRAPMEGVVAEIFRAPGEYITPADPAVIRLVVLDQLYGVFNVPVEDIAVFQVGGKVSVFLMSASKSVSATVDSIAPDIDGESGTIKVKVLIENPNGQLRAGDRCQMKPDQTQAAAKRMPRRMPSPSMVKRTVPIKSPWETAVQ
ncbi:efflux RND transporter periplasmic adaptor subunit [Stieleria sp. TO1_6]|uniref:efflux RND transporter periplasmic adaptor subunit n=1 Tax=Stieleria tagensis TaxID=2956795 RepID=UPI00209A6FD1|nr:efflux RND transporter periplasmic adaptor subunit [Stieleria tagensis]MCO8122209.1 efflux RND transporter periplasmic adaptor subunit [Stieleria tagensis]